VIRFAHIDHLRLGTPLAGLADCPEWLRRSAADATRSAVARLIQSVITHDCDFLLIAGRLVEPDALSAGVVPWLSQQLDTLDRRGIQVLVCDQSSENRALARLPNVTLFQRQDWVAAGRDPSGKIQLRHATPDRHSLGIRVDHAQNTVTDAALSYIAVPSLTSQKDLAAASHSLIQTATAGCPQAVSPDESGVFGMRLVEADPVAREWQSRFVATDSLGFRQYRVSVSGCENADDVAAKVLADLDRSDVARGRTLVVDVEATDMAWDCFLSSECAEHNLLSRLRHDCRFGHAGVWPRTFTAVPVCSDVPQFQSSDLRNALRKTVLSVSSESVDSLGSDSAVDRAADMRRRMQAAAEFLSLRP